LDKRELTEAVGLNSIASVSRLRPMIKFLHTRIRVSNLDSTIAFYEKLGFECTRRTDKSPAGNQLAFLELEGNEHFLELCYSPEFEVKFPEDLMHTCVGVTDIVDYCQKLENDGIEIWPGDWKEAFSSGSKAKMAFVTDPDGYEVEILERQ
jgi:lactoylglutathione lyase